jgi:hypothetical protein
MATVYRMRSFAPKDEGLQRIVAAFSIVNPDDFSYRNQTSFSGSDAQFISVYNSQTYWFGPSIAYRVNESIGLGATLYGLFGQEQFSSHLAGTFTDRDFSFLDGPLRLSSRYDLSRQTLSAIVLAGARFSSGPFSVGVVARSPSAQAWGEGKQTSSLLLAYAGDSDLDTQEVKFEPRRHDPIMLGAGVAYEKPYLWALSADVRWHSADKFKDADKDTVADTVKLKSVINASVGAETVLRQRFPLRAGFYTNYSPFDDTRIDMYGLTLATGIDSKQYTFTIGLNYAFGDGKADMVELSESNGRIVEKSKSADISVQSANFMISTAYRF